ncbi:MAG: hypothetical protein LC640_04570, partial [Frankia sp.]|nr:hypothetical protein [Frankia sp.]
ADSTGGSVDVRLFRDVDAQACNADYPDPIGEASVAVPTGQASKVTVAIPGINKKAKAAKFVLMLQISPSLGTGGLIVPPHVTRIRYDSTAANSSLTFSCIPNAGAKAC